MKEKQIEVFKSQKLFTSDKIWKEYIEGASDFQAKHEQASKTSRVQNCMNNS